MKITKIAIKNYRGLRTLEAAIPPSGAIAKGGNGRGKTSVLRAIRAALAAQDIGPDAITLGEERAEILVDLDALAVRRTITQNTSTVTVTRDGMRAQKPAKFLEELLGTAPLDPLDIFLEKDRRRRRALVLEALPCAVTRARLDAWIGDPAALPADFRVEGHGLEVVARAHTHLYTRRRAANALAEEARSEAERVAREAAALAGMITGNPVAIGDALDRAELARGAHARLVHARDAARAAEERAADARATIAEHLATAHRLRGEAAAKRPDGDALREATTAATDAALAVERLRVALDEAARAAAEADRRARIMVDAEAWASRLEGEAIHREESAAEIERALAAATPTAPSDEELACAAAAVEEAARAVKASKRAQEALEARARAEEHVATARARAEDAAVLDRAVKRLANDAPDELLAEAKGIPGLGLSDDGDLTLDGKRLDALCGREQMAFAIEVARRLNARTRILVVDGLERLDPDELEAFVSEATRDDWQLIGTRVDRGDLELVALETERAAAE
jgi:hypothetical protein